MKIDDLVERLPTKSDWWFDRPGKRDPTRPGHIYRVIGEADAELPIAGGYLLHVIELEDYPGDWFDRTLFRPVKHENVVAFRRLIQTAPASEDDLEPVGPLSDC